MALMGLCSAHTTTGIGRKVVDMARDSVSHVQRFLKYMAIWLSMMLNHIPTNHLPPNCPGDYDSHLGNFVDWVSCNAALLCAYVKGGEEGNKRRFGLWRA